MTFILFVGWNTCGDSWRQRQVLLSVIPQSGHLYNFFKKSLETLIANGMFIPHCASHFDDIPNGSLDVD